MRSELKAALLLIGIGVLALWAHRSGWVEQLEPQKLRSLLNSFGALAPLVFIVISSLRPLLFVPAGLISIVGGLAFGLLLGTVYTVISSTIGAIIAFTLTRYFGQELIRKIWPGRTEKWSQALHGQGMYLIFLTRLLPIFPFDAISYAAGLSQIKFCDFILGTILGVIPGTLLYTFLGSTIHEGLSPRLVGALLLVLGVGLIPSAYKIRRVRQMEQHDSD